MDALTKHQTLITRNIRCHVHQGKSSVDDNSLSNVERRVQSSLVDNLM